MENSEGVMKKDFRARNLRIFGWAINGTPLSECAFRTGISTERARYIFHDIRRAIKSEICTELDERFQLFQERSLYEMRKKNLFWLCESEKLKSAWMREDSWENAVQTWISSPGFAWLKDQKKG